VRGFIVKHAPPANLADGIRRVAAGERVTTPTWSLPLWRPVPARLPTARPTYYAPPPTAAPPRTSAATSPSPPPPCATTCRTQSPRWAPATGSTRFGSRATRAGSDRRSRASSVSTVHGIVGCAAPAGRAAQRTTARLGSASRTRPTARTVSRAAPARRRWWCPRRRRCGRRCRREREELGADRGLQGGAVAEGEPLPRRPNGEAGRRR
jgi:hypothetical protein